MSERQFAPDGSVDALICNLTALDGETISLVERREAHNLELARMLQNELDRFSPDDGAFRELYDEALSGVGRVDSEAVLGGNLASVSDRMKILTIRDRADICRVVAEGFEGELADLVCDSYRERDMRRFGDDEFDFDVIEDEFDTDVKFENRISYLHNSYADTAYTIFAELLGDATVTYSPDFVGVCEDVYYGRAGCCILPVENSTDGRLSSFRALIRKYDLKIVSVCTVETGDDAFTRFALLKKHMVKLKLPKSTRAAMRFEFDVTTERISELEAIFTAARANGIELTRIDSLPAAFSEVGPTYALSFDSTNGTLDGFLFYLFMEYPRFTPIGIYFDILNR